MGSNWRDNDVDLRVIASNPAALEQFYRQNVGAVTRFVTRWCRTPEDVADAVSATFVAVLFSAHTFDPQRGSPEAWLYSVARNEARSEGKSIGRRESLRLRLQGSALLSRDDADRIAEVIDAERRVSELDGALSSASPAELEMLRLMTDKDLTVTQASSSLGISPATGRKRLERLRRRVAAAGKDTTDLTPEEEQ
jgi:RNA polymerase sigma-70 factor (ECF subfamily)